MIYFSLFGEFALIVMIDMKNPHPISSKNQSLQHNNAHETVELKTFGKFCGCQSTFLEFNEHKDFAPKSKKDPNINRKLAKSRHNCRGKLYKGTFDQPNRGNRTIDIV